MSYQKLTSLLTEYQPVDSQELVCKNKILEFISTHHDCFERTCIPGHITASGFLLNKACNQALLMYHTKLNLWVQFGGHCDGNPDIRAVALKETQEESGVQDIVFVTKKIFDIDIHLIPARNSEPAHYHYDIRFLLKINSDEQPEKNHESQALAWFDPDIKKLPQNSDALVRMFNKWALWRL